MIFLSTRNPHPSLKFFAKASHHNDISLRQSTLRWFRMISIALTIAGSDPGGGAGVQADLKTFHRFGVYGTSVVTLVTVQNTMRNSRVEVLDAGLVGEQLDAVLEDLTPQAIKTGALGNTAVIEAVVARNFACPLVVDPVAMGKHGAELLDSGARSALCHLLLPRAALVTPNLDEASELAGMEVRDIPGMREAARRIADLGARSVLVKGGHLADRHQEADAVDVLWHAGEFAEFRMPRVATRHTHGTGCVYSAAITACLARGLSMVEAVRRAKSFVHEAIRTAPGLGGGSGPLNFWAAAAKDSV
jgi:hydroxymethylpyrimidine/phosphomethylpyrimidine kinase